MPVSVLFCLCVCVCVCISPVSWCSACPWSFPQQAPQPRPHPAIHNTSPGYTTWLQKSSITVVFTLLPESCYGSHAIWLIGDRGATHYKIFHQKAKLWFFPLKMKQTQKNNPSWFWINIFAIKTYSCLLILWSLKRKFQIPKTKILCPIYTNRCLTGFSITAEKLVPLFAGAPYGLSNPKWPGIQ